MMPNKRSILLMNLGSPDSTSVRDVRRYLLEFLMDERVIDMPLLWRTLLVKGIIVPFRAPKSAEAYKSIWTPEGSPLLELTRQLQKAVQAGLDEPVEISMRYGNPSSESVLQKLHAENPDLEEILLVPLYPHYAMSSYETAVEQVKEIHRRKNYPSKLATIRPYYDNPRYIQALADSFRPSLAADFDKLLFSYHGVPERHIMKGDCTGTHCLKVDDCCHVPSEAHVQCYRHQTIVTTELVTDALGLDPKKVEQSFQSRLGRDPWLRPYTAGRLAQLPGEGIRKLLVACPAFVSDCLETLEEIAEQGRHIFLEAGGESFTMIPCLNSHPLWVEAILAWVRGYWQGDRSMILNSALAAS